MPWLSLFGQAGMMRGVVTVPVGRLVIANRRLAGISVRNGDTGLAAIVASQFAHSADTSMQDTQGKRSVAA